MNIETNPIIQNRLVFIKKFKCYNKLFYDFIKTAPNHKWAKFRIWLIQTSALDHDRLIVLNNIIQYGSILQFENNSKLLIMSEIIRLNDITSFNDVIINMSYAEWIVLLTIAHTKPIDIVICHLYNLYYKLDIV